MQKLREDEIERLRKIGVEVKELGKASPQMHKRIRATLEQMMRGRINVETAKRKIERVWA